MRHEFLPYDVNNTDIGTYLFQAETFAKGKLWRETPQPLEFFQQWQVIVRDHSYAYYAPGHAFFLAIPKLLGLDPWITPWLSSGLSLFLLFLWSRRIAGTEAAVLAASLLALSPFFAVNGTSLLSHSSALLLTLLFLWLSAIWKQEKCPLAAFLSGWTLAFLFATRSLNAVALGLIWIPWILIPRERNRDFGFFHFKSILSRERRSWTLFATGVILPMGFLLLYYRELCGRWTTDLFTDYWPRNKFGFGTNLGRGEPGHFFQTYTHHDLSGMLANWKYSFETLALWWTGHAWITLLLLVLSLLLLAFHRLSSPPSNLSSASNRSLRSAPPLLLWILIHIFLYSLYYTPSTGFSGPRYLTEILPALALLTARLFLAAARLRSVWLLLLMLLFASSAVWFKSNLYAANAQGNASKRCVEQTVLVGARPPALVFLRSFWIGHPYPIFRNDASMNAPILFACDRGTEDARLIEKYPDRNAYILAVAPQKKGLVQTELIPIYDGYQRRWIRDPATVCAPFFIGSRFTRPLELRGEIARQLFHPTPDEIVGQ